MYFGIYFVLGGLNAMLSSTAVKKETFMFSACLAEIGESLFYENSKKGPFGSHCLSLPMVSYL